MARAFAEIAFTPTVLSAQRVLGSEKMHAGLLDAAAPAGDRLGPAEIGFISARDGFYQATVSETGWPYVQFRGGPAGFLKVLDEKTIGYADFRGNRQYLSVGNLSANDRISLFLMDYPNRARLKIWGRARTVSVKDDRDRVTALHVAGYRALPERAVLITVEAFDWNCPQHIPQRFTVEELEAHLAPVRSELARLEDENEALRMALGGSGAADTAMP